MPIKTGPVTDKEFMDWLSRFERMRLPPMKTFELQMLLVMIQMREELVASGKELDRKYLLRRIKMRRVGGNA